MGGSIMENNNIKVFIEICREGALLPAYAKPGDAGMDVCAAEDVIIRPGETVIIPTGLKLAIPEGYEVQVRPRSGISLKTPLRIPNAPGTIDSGYRDELGIIMTNTSESSNYDSDAPEIITTEGNESGSDCCFPELMGKLLTLDSIGNQKGTYRIRKGDRVAQLVLQVVPRMQLTAVASVADIGRNRGGGYGSSGV